MKTFLALFVLVLTPSLGFAEAVVGQAAPAFQVKDATGKDQTLSNYAGQWVVLEWYNKDCPYVRKHYGSGNMQNLQKTYTAKGVKWLTVLSSAPGKQGYLEAAQALENAKQVGSAATAVLLDPSGAMGQAYGAKTTPHMYVIDPKGKLVYAGAIDDNNSANPAVIPTSKNYVAAALDEALAGKAVMVSSSQPYGCSVKY
ncbi:MAG TPA: thioredoxin family protein [Deltaproteobacteria bacterium]|nr:thioredoxin family protein [Deltaproteobacteria bacterium]